MSLKLPFRESDVDALVRGYLESVAEQVDVAPLAEGIAARMARPMRSGPALLTGLRNWGAKVPAWATAVVLLVAVTAALYLTFEPEPAGAYALVSAAQASLETGPDRCYQVEGRLPAGWLKANPLLRGGEQAIVWTRGDRFRVLSESDGGALCWGQDEARNFWFIAGNVGFSFRRNETPPIVNRTRTYLALNPRQLLRRFLDDFDLTVIKDREVAGNPVVRVWATRKPESKEILFDAAWIEIDPRSKVIRRLEVERAVGKKAPPFGLTFTLVEQASLGDHEYQVESNLPAGAEMLGPDQAAERDRRFWELFKKRRKPAAPRS